MWCQTFATLVLAAFCSLNEIAQKCQEGGFYGAFRVFTVTLDVFIDKHISPEYIELKRHEIYKICDLKHFCGVLLSFKTIKQHFASEY